MLPVLGARGRRRVGRAGARLGWWVGTDIVEFSFRFMGFGGLVDECFRGGAGVLIGLIERRALPGSFDEKPFGRQAVKKQSRRSFIVLSSLVGVLTLTSVLLRAMQGAPLTPDAASSLMVGDSRTALRVIFNTQVPPQTGGGQSIYVHHSRTPRGDVASLAHVDRRQ